MKSYIGRHTLKVGSLYSTKLPREKRLRMSVTQILIVEDFVPWQHFISIKLQSEIDLRIISVAADGLEAVHKAKEVQPDLILMDLSLAGMNRIEATRQLRILASGSRILFFSDRARSN